MPAYAPARPRLPSLGGQEGLAGGKASAGKSDEVMSKAPER